MATRKRIRTNTILEDEFNEDESYNKIIQFIIENNLSLNILNSPSFTNLLTYFNRLTPVLNRWKINKVLNTTFANHLAILNSELQANIQTLGRFSLVFDIWTANTQTAYFGVIISYINADFELKYQLIG